MNQIYLSYNVIKDKRILGVLLVSFYAIAYDYIVRGYLFPVFGYALNYEYHQMTISEYSIYVIVCAFPFVFYKGFNHIASIISLFCHIFVYLPFCHTLFVAGYPLEVTIGYLVCFFVAQCAFFMTDSWKFGKRQFLSSNQMSFQTFEKVVLFLMLLALIINFSKMHMVNIFSADESSLLYELREENRTSSFPLNDYLTNWLNHILLPILMVCYLQQKNKMKLAAAFAGMLCMFMIDMQKISFLIPFVILLFYYLYKKYPIGYLTYFHAMLILACATFPLLLMPFLSNPKIFTISAILIDRTICIEGRQLATYMNFFEITNHPYTYYTHINIINKLTGAYPYAESIGKTVSYGEGNSNATFLLMDGMAGGGIIGCVFIAAIFVILKAYFNTVENYYDKSLCIIILFFSISSLMNASLFTSLMTGGFLLFYFIFKKVNLYDLQIK